MFKFISYLGLLVLATCPRVCAAHGGHDAAGSSAEHSDWEVGFSLEYTYLDERGHDHGEEEDDHDEHSDHRDRSAAGLHLHAIRRLADQGPLSYFGAGLGAEIIFADDPHFGAMGSLAFYPSSSLSLMLSPGVEFADHGKERRADFAMHYEAALTFDYADLHIGPVIGFSHSHTGEHYSAGVHVGF